MGENRSIKINTVDTSYSSECNCTDTNRRYDVTYRFILLAPISALFLEYTEWIIN